MREELLELMNKLKMKFVEREEVIEGLILTLPLGFIGGNILLAGPPGTAKTSLVRELASNLNLSFGELTIYPSMLPNGSLYTIDQVKLVKENKVEVHESSIMKSDIAFLDELGRANEIFLHSLISFLLNRSIVIDQIGYVIYSPTLTVIGATNYLPADERFEAVYDRFQLKVIVLPPSEVRTVLSNFISDVSPVIPSFSIKPVISRASNEDVKKRLLEVLYEGKKRAHKYIPVAERVYKFFKLDTVGENAGLIHFSKTDFGESIGVDEYRVKISLRSLNYLPIALGIAEYLYGSLQMIDIARITSYFVTTPDEYYYPLFQKTKGNISYLQKYIAEKILKDVQFDVGKVDIARAEYVLRELTSIMYELRKRNIDGKAFKICGTNVCLDLSPIGKNKIIDFTENLKEVIDMYDYAKDPGDVNALYMKIPTIESLFNSIRETNVAIYEALLKSLLLNRDIRKELELRLRKNILN